MDWTGTSKKGKTREWDSGVYRVCGVLKAMFSDEKWSTERKQEAGKRATQARIRQEIPLRVWQ